MAEPDRRKIHIRGITYTVAAFTAWGILPLYGKALKQVPSGEILAHRIFWSFIFAAGALFFYERRKELTRMLSLRSNPLFSVFLGIVVLKEKLNFWQAFSILLAAAACIQKSWLKQLVVWTGYL